MLHKIASPQNGLLRSRPGAGLSGGIYLSLSIPILTTASAPVRPTSDTLSMSCQVLFPFPGLWAFSEHLLRPFVDSQAPSFWPLPTTGALSHSALFSPLSPSTVLFDASSRSCSRYSSFNLRAARDHFRSSSDYFSTSVAPFLLFCRRSSFSRTSTVRLCTACCCVRSLRSSRIFYPLSNFFLFLVKLLFSFELHNRRPSDAVFACALGARLAASSLHVATSAFTSLPHHLRSFPACCSHSCSLHRCFHRHELYHTDFSPYVFHARVACAIHSHARPTYTSCVCLSPSRRRCDMKLTVIQNCTAGVAPSSPARQSDFFCYHWCYF